LNLRLIPDKDQIFFLRMRVVFIKINFYPFKQKGKKTKAFFKRKKSEEKRNLPGRKTIWLMTKIFRKIIKSSRLKTLYLNIDAEDVITNAYLIPIFAGLHRNNINLSVNYAGNVEMIINVENIGETFKLGDFECVPVVKIGMGFGSGGGGGESDKKSGGKGGGAGAGIGIEPIGFLVTKGDEISMVSVSRSKGLQSVFEKVPDLIEKMMQMRKDKEPQKKK